MRTHALLGRSSDAIFGPDAPSRSRLGRCGLAAAALLVAALAIAPLAAAAPLPPQAEAVSATASSSYADLSASVNPQGTDTHVVFEYGTTAAYGSSFPAPSGEDIGEGSEPVAVSAHLTGLAAGTTYHYRLVAGNAGGTVETPDATFTTFATGGPVPLPDGRVWELVSSNKGDNDVETGGLVVARGVAGGDEEGVAFSSVNALPGAENGALVTANVAHRTAAGWVTAFPSVPSINQTTLAGAQPVMLSRDLNAALVASKLNLTGDAPAGENLFVKKISPPSLRLVTPLAATVASGYEPRNAVGASDDFSRVFFQTPAKLTADSPAPLFAANLYEWDGSTLRNVGILPGETEPTPEGVIAFEPSLRPVSADGSQVLFGAQPAGAQPQVFLRRAGTETIEVSAPAAGVTDPEGPQAASFAGAAADGSSVFFTSRGTLTADAFTGEGPSHETDLAPNLYRYDTATGELADLTVDRSDELGADVDPSHVVVSASGTSAYFVAGGVLAPGGVLGAENLYRWSAGGGIEFVAGLDPSDNFVNPFEPPEAAADRNGDALAFVSLAALTGESPPGVPEIYRYAAGAGLDCVSCRPGSALEGARMPMPTMHGGAGGNPISADGGRVFFSTRDRLVSEDTNGRIDAYEWEGGLVHLISDGSGDYDSRFVDASPSGRDVFFVTRDRLVSADQDENTDIYDAREGGGFPQPAPPGAPCEAEACRPPLEAAPAAASLGSRSFRGPANRKPRKHARRHHRSSCKHRTGKCVRKHHHGRPAGKRG